MRIASLLASGTELVCALGAGDELVGRSHECDHPEWVRRLPVLSRPTFDTDGPSAEVDRRVRQKLRAGEPLYEIDEALLASLAPDVVVSQSHCEVCAVSAAGCVREPVAALRTGTVEGILEGFREVAAVIGRTEAGERLCAAARAHLARWRDATAALRRPSVVCLEWIDPPFVLGNWGPELVRCAGGEPRLGHDGGPSTAISWEEVRAADPEVLIVAPCGFPLERTLAERAALEARPGWSALRAVRTGRAYVADGNRYFNRSGPGAFETVDVLAQMLHPDAFAPAHEGTVWRRLV